MLSYFAALALASSAALVHAATLNDVCTTAYAQASLPSDDFYEGIKINHASVIVSAVTNTSVSGQNFYPDAVFDYCNVTFAYSHVGRNDSVLVTYWLPTPDKFQNRYLSTGGGGYAINSGDSSLPGGIIYGAAAGITDGGFGGFQTQFDSVYLIQNGMPNTDALLMFGYQAIHELSALGKEFTKNFFKMSNTKLYSYYQGCSEGGREGFSQIQRFGDEYDGAITGAPAIRYSFQQVQHLYSNVVEQTVGYYPAPCELSKIVNETIAACDSLDGKVDGVVSRTDLCKLHFNMTSIIGMPYNCPATSPTLGPLGMMGPPGMGLPGMAKRQFPIPVATPAQNGTVTAKAVEVADLIIDGLHDLQGRQAYLSYQPSAAFSDAQTQYNSTSDSWELDVSFFGAEFVIRFIELINGYDFANLDGVTYDTLKTWMYQGWQAYKDTLQTTFPDLTPFKQAGGKILHFHGESDDSIPPASSIRYYESVREIMYPNLGYNESIAALGSWYRLFLVPGAAHCSVNALQPNGPFPQTNLAVLIDWVEQGVEPVTLNGTILQGEHIGDNQQMCAWPLRPLWTNNGTKMDCVYDQPSIDSWIYDLNAFDVPVF